MSNIRHELDRLQSVFRQLGKDLNLQPPASDAAISSIDEITGIQVTMDLKDLWGISNGSGGTMWFAEGDEDFTPYYFLSVEEVLENWQFFAPYDASVYEEWYDDEQWGERDPRIQRHFLRHKDWLAFAEFNGGSDLLLYDADPTTKGQRGQIINYIHDPDGIDWTASSFIEFFTASNKVLEAGLENPDELAENLWI